MDRLIEYLAMDGDAIYVWPALGFAALVIVTMTVWSVAALRASSRRLDDLQPLVERRRAERRAQRQALADDVNAGIAAGDEVTR